MTSSESKPVGTVPPKKSESMTRKQGLKGPKQPTITSTTIATTLRAGKKTTQTSTVQALTSKFNELSEASQTQNRTVQKHKVGKQGARVICRKPSSSKYKRSEFPQVRRRTAARKTPSDEESCRPSSFRLNVNQINAIQRNVLQKVTVFEEKEGKTIRSIPEVDRKRTTKLVVPKVLVDIDLNDDKCLKNAQVPNSSLKHVENQRNGVSVKTAITLFEKSKDEIKKKYYENNVEPEKKDTKQKPVATIRPILKKPETAIKTRLSPRDSLNRKKYMGMKRDQLKLNKENNQQVDPVEKKNSDNLKCLVIEGKENEAQKVETNCEKSKNYTGVFGQISQSSVTISSQNSTKKREFAKLLKSERKEEVLEEKITKEVSQTVKETVDEIISQTADQTINQTVSSGQNRKPNMSFLWSKKEELQEPQQPQSEWKSSRMDMPLPLPPENFFPEISELVYDDVLPKSCKSNQDDFDRRSAHSDETVYDDIGLYDQTNEGYEKIYNDKTSGKNRYDSINEEVEKLNHLNKVSNGISSESLYCISDKLSYNYDDGEGEGYQYIRKAVKVMCKDDESESYQYIQDDSNIYEDIKSVKNRILKEKEFYEDVNSMTETASISNCYESVYNGIFTGNQEYADSNKSDSSNNSSRNTYEKSNSLYGITSSALENTSLTEVNENDSGYQVTGFGITRPNSETSQSNSDEWVEVSESESEDVRKNERTKKPRMNHSGWSQKVRRRWSKLQKRTNKETFEDESKIGSSEDHLYESIGQYENAELSLGETGQAVQAEQPYSLSEQPIYCDEQCIDDFDSQSSGDENATPKLPDIPNNSYNITKSLKAAGKRLRKNFSLRKSDLSKSLKRFKRPSRTKVDEKMFVSPEETEVNVSQCSDGSAANSDPNVSTYVNNSDSSSGSHIYVKSKSASDLKTYKYQKTWTFRSKFKRNSSSDVQIDAENADNADLKNSTFYLSLSEMRPQALDKSEKKDDLLNEIQNRISQRAGGSLENVSEVKKNGSVRRRSQPAESRLSKARPSIPPPPPPAVRTESGSDGTRYSDVIVRKDRAIDNSLYAECGLFDKQKKRPRCPSDSSTSWYTEVGLYSANENSSHGKQSQMFVDEPLYQFYTECVNQQARDDILKNYDSEGYEEINDYYSIINEKRRTLDVKNVRPNFEDFNDDVPPKVSPFRSQTRTLWCQIPVVVNSCILNTLTDHQKKLQEAKFEILMSEGSYMNSLNVLENHFMKKINELNMIAKRDFNILFGNILSVKKSAENFLNDLEHCWQDDIMLNGISDIVYRHATTHFHVYVKYCKNQICIYRTLRELIDKNVSFETALKEIESDAVCQNLSIHSFLMLPMQRITRLPLLLGAVIARLSKTDDEFDMCKASFEELNKVVQKCDDEARKMEKFEEMLILSQQMEFPREIRSIPIMMGSRFLVKSGQVTQLVNRDENKLTFGKKFTKVSLTLFLFTDLLVVTKKKGVRNYVVVDHCPRNLIQLQTTDGLAQLPCKMNTFTDLVGKNLMLLTMLENHEKKTVEMVLSLEMESDRQRWLDAVAPKLSQNPDESIYEEWDCPQVIAIYEFTSTQPDELSLCIGDVVNVLKKINDGWYQGERLRDGARGWFPQNHTQEISSQHVRAKNKKQRYKFLALSRNFIESQMKNGK